MDSGDQDLRTRRIGVAGFMLIAVAAVLLVRYAVIMVPGNPAVPRTTAELMERGPILDRRGRIMAIQTRLDTVTAWRPEVRDIERTAVILGEILDRDPREIRDRLSTAEGFLTVQRTITPSQSSRITAEIREGNLRGIRLQPDTGRSYPERDSAASIVGYTGVDNVGLAGIEYMFTEYLVPAATSSGTSPSGNPGNQVFLTLDLAIQSAADDLGRQLLQEHQADLVTIAVATADTGEILALSTLPSFDPNSFRSYSPDARRNHGISRIYEPGSVFKIFSVAALLELGAITQNDRFDTSRGYVAEGGAFIITDLSNYGVISPQQIIQFSSNVGAAYASERADAGSFFTMLTAFGFGSPTGIALNGEERGLLADPSRWSRRTQQTLAIGQEIGVTAVQMVAAATALANDGILLRPQIVHRIVSPGGEIIQQWGREPVRQVLSPENARTMLRMMRSSTERSGTAWRIQVDGVSVAAKTGTAEVFDTAAGRYSDSHFIASTLALVPAEDPRLIVYVVIDHPRGESFFGGRIAAPAVRDMITFLVPYWDIPRDTDMVTEHPGQVVLRPVRIPEIDDVMPDLSGLPLRALMPLLAREDLDVQLSGSGWVRSQTPAAGTELRPGTTIRIELE